ncbi:MAG: 2-C-methyl-D-erythritol 2,4-cyclodiphosphate synthase [Actinomycetota bacterium]
MSEPRIGLGFDLHPRAEGRTLLLAGVRFDDEPGLEGRSDADVVCHALAEAMLGAAALGDLGEHFPDSDPATEGIAGLELLARVAAIVGNAGWKLGSCDLTVIAERPAVAPRRGEMRRRLAATLDVDVGSVSVKATRPEGLGLSGDGAGCIAIAMLGPVREPE